jgi:Multicopper oxidase
MTISRRSFVMGATVAAIAPFNLTRSVGRNDQFPNGLKIPPLLEGKPSGSGKIYELTVAAGKSDFLSGVATPTIGFNGSYLGPTIRCRAGDRVTLRVKNSLAEPTTVHWHGLHIPAIFDGGPHQIIEPGAVWEPSFEIKQKASLCWYHSHLMEHTGEQVLRGLAGLLLIEDDESRSPGLPVEYGVDDVPLVIQDRRFQRDGSFDYALAMHDTMMGYKGNVVLVNGTVNAHVILRRQRTRLRILNGSNSRISRSRGRRFGRRLTGASSAPTSGSARSRRARRITCRYAIQPDGQTNGLSRSRRCGRDGPGHDDGWHRGQYRDVSDYRVARGTVRNDGSVTSRAAYSPAKLDCGASHTYPYLHSGHAYDGHGGNDG